MVVWILNNKYHEVLIRDTITNIERLFVVVHANNNENAGTYAVRRAKAIGLTAPIVTQVSEIILTDGNPTEEIS